MTCNVQLRKLIIKCQSAQSENIKVNAVFFYFVAVITLIVCLLQKVKIVAFAYDTLSIFQNTQIQYSFTQN